MEKRKRWQFWVIVAVLGLTLYNILPTIFYYSKPLTKPIDAARAEKTAEQIVQRVNSLEPEAKEWLHSFTKMLRIKPKQIVVNQEFPGIISVTFPSEKEAQVFERFLPRAGSTIPFVPAQLSLAGGEWNTDPATVHVIRNVQVRLDPAEIDQIFQFSPKLNEQGEVSDLYREIVNDRFIQIGLALAGTSPEAATLESLLTFSDDPQANERLLKLSREIVDIEKTLGSSNPIAKRYFASFTQIDTENRAQQVQRFLALLEKKSGLINERIEKLRADKTAKDQKEEIDQLERQVRTLETATIVIQRNQETFAKGATPFTQEELTRRLNQSWEKVESADKRQTLSLEGRNPYIHSLAIEWDDGEIELVPYKDVQTIRLSEGLSEREDFLRNKVNQYLANDLALVARKADETILPAEGFYRIDMDQLTDTQSLLSFNLGFVAKKRAAQTVRQLQSAWQPTHEDLILAHFPIYSHEEYKQLPPEEQKLGLVVYAPASAHGPTPDGFRSNSIYVIARGLGDIVRKYQETPTAQGVEALQADFSALRNLLQQEGFIGYPGNSYGIDAAYKNDYIFELPDYYSQLLAATRENFVVKGSKRYAVLDMSDVEQRLLVTNQIQDRIQEDLLKWRDAYAAAQIDLNPVIQYSVPPPTKNVYWQNFLLSLKKYFRGDERKVLKWGLDLSGGKTVRIGLRDKSGAPVTDPDDLRQVVNELYTRVNKLGVSERTIRIENNNILLEFPGSQALSAADLVKASTMTFHVVNEKFGRNNPALAETVNQFLQEVWNEAVVSNRQDQESINQIAYQHLGGGETLEGELRYPRNEAAKILYENGLRLPNPREQIMSSAFDDTYSSIALHREGEYGRWDFPGHPLVVTFYNYALEGSNLENIQAGYDPTEGNILLFGVKRSYDARSDQVGSPRDDFYTWTSHFSEEGVTGTPLEEYSQGRGWRMAVNLNGSVITAPHLSSGLRDQAKITGRFSSREVNQLAADLKAGSLSFSPKILSEENVSPELGKEERARGIMASILSLVLVVVAMVAYYRFAGLVASCAVLLNIFIMWGVLQNLDAALTLPGIAGIVLTIGMAVDANVLVFERIREEFAISGRIASAIQTGYRKAFSAIFDSNITTIIAALILIQFDSGPIKGFAVVLIIGILSSMFTALFMTRYFFAGWVQNPRNTQLTMAEWIGKTKIHFLRHAKKVMIATGLLMVVGGYFLVAQRNTMFGMDFTGGYSLTVTLEELPEAVNYRLSAMNALLDQGATLNDFQVRQLTRPNHLRIQLGNSMEEVNHPFYNLPERYTEGKFVYEYQKNPRLAWVVQALEMGGLSVQPSELATLQNEWTVMSGQFSDAMRNNAILGLSIALFSILAYITFRFEFKYAIASVIGLAHDVAVTLAVLALFHRAGFPVQIDLQVVGALMTIIGYSLNDTIIVFDRIREDLVLHRKWPFPDIINHALNVTLTRTIMTSLTTLLVLLALVLFGGPSIFAFALVMTLGVIFGTLSSLFIVSPIMLFFHQREERARVEAAKRA